MSDLCLLEETYKLNCRKTIIRYIENLKSKKWLQYNYYKKHYIFSSFTKIREFSECKTRLAIKINIENYKNIEALTGAVIFSYLHKDFWRKVKNKKSVLIKGRTYGSFGYNFNYKNEFAPVSIYGVEAIFNIPPSTACRLKLAAAEAKLIEIKPNYELIDLYVEKDQREIVKDLLNIKNLVYLNGKYMLRGIDHICPLFEFVKLKSIINNNIQSAFTTKYKKVKCK